jgi:hypothetical protein
MLAVIGPNWLTAKDETGKRRLDNPDDFIVIEISARAAVPVVPVLSMGLAAQGAKGERASGSLRLSARRQAVEVRHTSFSRDAEARLKDCARHSVTMRADHAGGVCGRQSARRQ